jgi:hypothetical protein
VSEFFRLADRLQDQIWPNWSATPSPLLLITERTEFLIHHYTAPSDFTSLGDAVSARPRKLPTALLATFPVFGPPAVIAVGEPQATEAKTSTPWLFVLMHEHFHQLQYEQPGYYSAVEAMGLSRGDQTGMWILNYPFPYDQPSVTASFGHLRDLLLHALDETEHDAFRVRAATYVNERKRVFAQLSPDDHKYISFQLWQEGMARYTQIRSAEAAAAYQPTPLFMQLPDYEPFAAYAAVARLQTLAELRAADIAKMKRGFVYSFGAAEGLLLDRLNTDWRQAYFQHLLSTDELLTVK